MKKSIQQYRFFAPDSPQNYAIETTEKLVDGTFFGEKVPIFQLGIQGLPGTRFYLNDTVTPVIIGDSGIFEIELGKGITEISKVKFDCASLDAIAKSQDAYLIIDTLYLESENVENREGN